jgi:hypothetical protein
MKQYNNNRVLGAYEKLFWIIGQNYPLQFVMVAELEGTATIDEWRKALDAVQNRHALFSVTVNDYTDGISRYEVLNDAPIPLRVGQGNSITTWEVEVEKELAIPFDNPQLPLVRAVLIQEENRSVFMFVVHHTIGDGISSSYVFRDLLCAINGETLKQLPLPPTTDDIIGLTQNTPLDSLTSHFSPRRREENEAENKALKIPTVKRLRVSTELTEKIQKRAREEGTTVHGALYAALIHAGMQISMKWKEQPVRILTSASSRAFLNAGESSSLFINSRMISFDAEKELSFWDLARFAKNSLNGIVSTESITGATNGLRKTVFNEPGTTNTFSFLKNDRAQELLLTNLGRLPYPTDFGKLKLSALWGPAIAPRNEGEQVVGVSTINGAMLLTQTSFAPFNQYLEKVVEALNNASF